MRLMLETAHIAIVVSFSAYYEVVGIKKKICSPYVTYQQRLLTFFQGWLCGSNILIGVNLEFEKSCGTHAGDPQAAFLRCHDTQWSVSHQHRSFLLWVLSADARHICAASSVK